VRQCLTWAELLPHDMEVTYIRLKPHNNINTCDSWWQTYAMAHTLEGDWMLHKNTNIFFISQGSVENHSPSRDWFYIKGHHNDLQNCWGKRNCRTYGIKNKLMSGQVYFNSIRTKNLGCSFVIVSVKILVCLHTNNEWLQSFKRIVLVVHV